MVLRDPSPTTGTATLEKDIDQSPTPLQDDQEDQERGTSPHTQDQSTGQQTQEEKVLRSNRFLQRYLAQYKLAIGKNGSLYSVNSKKGPMRLFVGKVTIDQVEYVRDLPREPGKAAQAAIFDRVITATFTNPDALAQQLCISYDDMESKNPNWLRELKVMPPPHRKRRDDVHYALNVLSHAPGTPTQEAYSASGVLLLPDQQPVFLNPLGPALTPTGTDDRYHVRWSGRHKGLESVPYGFRAPAQTDSERREDYYSLLRFFELSPGQPGYGEALLGVTAFSPLAQLSPSGAAHLIVYGLTGSLKSASARLVLQCYADIWGREEVVTANMREAQSTIFACDQLFYFLSGLPALADDALKGKNATEQDRTKFFKLVSALGGHAASKKGGLRSRWNEGNGGHAHDFYPRCSMIFTVEHLPDAESQASDLARYALVMLGGPGSVDLGVLTEMQSLPFAQAMNRATAGYIQWLLPRLEEVLADAAEREQAYHQLGLHVRLPQTYAKLEAGIAAYLRYGLAIGAIEEELAQAYMDSSRERLIALARAQSHTMGIKDGKATANDGVSVFYRCLRDALGHRLALSDKDRRRIPAGDEQFHYLPQPPAALAHTGFNLARLGWTFNEQQAVYNMSSSCLEIGVLRRGHFKGSSVSSWIALIPCAWWEQLQARLEKIASDSNTPLPGAHDLRKLLASAGRLCRSNSTNLWGREENNGIKGRVYYLDLTPIIEPDDTDGDDPPPGCTEDAGQGSDTRSGEEEQENLSAPPSIPLLYTAQALDQPLSSVGENAPLGDLPSLLQNGGDVQRKHASEDSRQKTQTPSEMESPMPEQKEQSAPQPAPPEKKWEGGFKMRYKDVPTLYLDIRSGEGVFGDQPLALGKKPTLAHILANIPPECRRIYLIGPRPGIGSAESLYQWYRDRQVGEHWRTKKFHRDDYLPLLDVEHRENKRGVRIQRMAGWFGEGDYTPRQAQKAMQLLDRILQRSFDPHAKCLATPGSTGLALWDRSRTASYPNLDEDLQRLIRATSGQGRFELITFPDRPQLEGFTYLDGRFFYAPLTTGLGFGPARRERAGEFNPDLFDPNQRARYKVHFKIPDDWNHVGLLPVKDEEDTETWLYPSEPKFEAETWVDAVEVLLARERGWDVRIQERILFQHATAGHPWPLDTWSKKLIGARRQVEIARDRGDIAPILAELVLDGLRAILLHAIGGFHRRDTTETRIVYSRDELAQVPAKFSVTPHADGTWTYECPVPLDAWAKQFQHPEFSAAIWARCRKRVLLSETKKRGEVVESTGVLTLPYKDLVGIRVDAMYLARDPEWPDDGQVGRFRVKGKLNEPCLQPESYEDLNELRDQAVEAYQKGKR